HQHIPLLASTLVPPTPRPPPFPYTTLFRSRIALLHEKPEAVAGQRVSGEVEVPLEEAEEPGGERGALSQPLHAHEERVPEDALRSEEHTSELQSLTNLVCRLLLENKQ